MQGLGSIRRRYAASPRARILFWAAVVGLLCGSVEFGLPLDRLLHTLREAVRSQPADGQTVVIEVNNESLAKIKEWGSRRSLDAKVVDNLFALGARRVLFDKVYADPSPVGDDAVFAAAMRRHPGRVFLATRFEANRITKKRESLRPVPILRAAAELGSINAWRDNMGYTSGVPFSTELDGQHYRSFAAILAGVHSRSKALFTPDYSIRYETVPAVNLVDVLHPGPAARIIAGHDVVVAKTADSLGDTHMVPGQGPIPGIYVQVIAAQTLRRHLPVNIGWLLPFVVALLTAFLYLSTPNALLRHAAMTTTAAGLVIGPVFLDSINVELQVVPAIALLGVVFVRARILARVVSNPLTGLPTLNSVLWDGRSSQNTLVGLKLGNYADLRATLTDLGERALLFEIVRRLEVSGDVSGVMHGADSFVWETRQEVSQQLFDHLEGMYALLSSPIDVGGRLVDLQIGFGIEAEAQRPLTNRIASVQVSAEDAIVSGAKWNLHDPGRLQDAEFRQSLLSRLDLALKNGEIWVAYQPKLDLREKRVTGAEALVRWSHPDRGLIPPDRFVPMAEQANRIAGLTLFVLESAIRDVRKLDSVAPDFSVAVNLSVRMLAHPNLAGEVSALLDRHGLTPDRLTLEITESEEIDASGSDLAALNGLKALGVRISIDDYGTKYSTLDYVRQFPAAEIKIDQRFVGNIHTDRSVRIMAQSTIELAHSLGLTVVAEGVEHTETLSCLTELGCDVAQGFLIGRPIRFSELERFVAQTRLRRVA